MRAAVFLDRDDTLIANRAVTAGSAHPGDLCDPALVRLLDGVGEGLAKLKQMGFALIVVSNQGCVARGVCSEDDVLAVNGQMAKLLRDGYGVELDGVYFCPYHPRGRVEPWNVEHELRKPSGGMLRLAAMEHGLDMRRSWMIGDTSRDMEAGRDVGLSEDRLIFVDHPWGQDTREGAERVAHVRDFAHAVELIETARASERAQAAEGDNGCGR